MHTENIQTAGVSLQEAGKALIMIHGRGGSAEDILSLARHLNVQDYALVAPQATNNSWYPQSFLAPLEQNEPYLSSALALLSKTVDSIEAQGIAKENIYFMGFSQGACLALDFTTRNAAKYGGIAAFTGGLIGDAVYPDHYNGNFNGTPVFIGTSDPDFHVPVQRVHDTTALMQSMGANVTEKVYPNMGHTISQDEIDLANQLIFK
ncbi:phospholipase [Flavobacterium rivuli WB 3.3-2 = DSM 21788]|uniref:Phospholipase n=1 Tax=Flavobacterium rivuli WB 3.3-2 = DSM 21788 TaxID=1121895 RepID=A0A0A2MK48_9FLAO|nr:dienelactone hydrolase family protein [Flavobacterium rivuli]KGO88655.1 phospholipase [Flavobacterium rivuli WB 3.3-2 = DSM 21788]